MKFTISVPYLFLLTASLAVLSTDATSLRREESLLSVGGLPAMHTLNELDRHSIGLRRLDEEGGYQNEEENDDQVDEEQGNGDQDEENEEDDDAAEEVDDDAVEADNSDASDDLIAADQMDLETYVDLWTIALYVWGSGVLIAMFSICCCRREYKKKKTLQEAFKESLVSEPAPVYNV